MPPSEGQLQPGEVARPGAGPRCAGASAIGSVPGAGDHHHLRHAAARGRAPPPATAGSAGRRRPATMSTGTRQAAEPPAEVDRAAGRVVGGQRPRPAGVDGLARPARPPAPSGSATSPPSARSRSAPKSSRTPLQGAVRHRQARAGARAPPGRRPGRGARARRWPAPPRRPASGPPGRAGRRCARGPPARVGDQGVDVGRAARRRGGRAGRARPSRRGGRSAEPSTRWSPPEPWMRIGRGALIGRW